MAATNLTELTEGFRLYCMAEGKSPRTIRWYLGKLDIFQKYLVEHGLPTDAGEVTTTHLRGFLVHLKQNVRADQNNPRKPTRDVDLSDKTIQGYARTLKAFFTWLYREDLIPTNPGKLLKIPKAAQVIIETLKEDQIKRLLDVIDKRSANGFRDYCIVLMLLDTGIRLSELANLKINDVDLERSYFKVMGKGARERMVPFGAKVQTALWKYVKKFRPEPCHPNVVNLFLQHDGRPLRSEQVYRRIRELGESARIDGVRCSPHTFRHTFAKTFLVNGGDLFTLQKILGHSSLAVVRLYVELSPEDVQIQHRKHSPVDRIKS
jgi:integrase/recombinase XerD